MSYKIFPQNTLLGSNSELLSEEKYFQLKDFIKFKKHKKIDNNFDFSKKTKLNGEFKCVNWFKYRLNNYLLFIILKARHSETFETYYFHFKFFDYMFYTKEDITKNKYLKELYELSKQKSTIYDIYSYVLKDCLQISVAHYKNFNTSLNYFKEIEDTIENVNDTQRGDIYLLATNFIKDSKHSSCENQFMNIRVFYLLNNIEPSCTFKLDDFEIFQGLKTNTYFIQTSKIKNFFKNKIEVVKKDIPRYYISFDIESDVNKSRSIDSPHNIITHCALEYFVSTFYNPNYERTVLPFNFCLINKDFHYLTSIQRNEKTKITSKSKYYKNKDKLYYDIIKGNISNKFKIAINEEIDYIEKNPNYMYLKKKDLNLPDEEFKKLFENKKYVFTNEVTLIQTIIKFFNLYETDYLLTYNGNTYDFPQLGKRLSLLTNSTITDVLQFQSIYSLEPTYYSNSNNTVTNYSIKNMISNTPYFSVDLFNYVKKFYQNENSFSLKEISKKLFNIKAICVCRLKTNKFYEYEIILLYNENKSNLIDFLKVLVSSNYCFINNYSYMIIDKTEIIKNKESIYDVDVNNLASEYTENKNVKILKSFRIRSVSYIDNNLNNDTKFLFENYKDYLVQVDLSKDDVEISLENITDKITNIQIANYCIHDTLLCRHLFEKYLVKENIDIFSNLNYLPQNIALCYRNNVNINGYILKTCFKEKTFLLKSKKIQVNTFTGGKVFEPKQNFLKEPVLVFDFESLYPSIIIKYNISPECLVLLIKTDSILEFNIVKLSLKNFFPEEYYTIVFNIDSKEQQVSYNILVYTKIYKDKTKRSGILNIMLQDLKKIRKEYKALCKKYKEEKIDYMFQHCNLTQNNVKLLMNCVYGLMGSVYSMFSCKFSSLSVTSLGVKNITFLEQYLNNTKISNNTFSIYNPDYEETDIFLEDNKIEVYNPSTLKLIELKKNISIDYPFNHELVFEVIYGDTDSIMVVLKNINTHPYILENKNEYEERSIKLISFLGNQINKIINNDILNNEGLNLEFENIFFEMIIQSKKKYLGKSIEPINLNSYEEMYALKNCNFILKEFNKGTSIKRRDICKFQKNLMIKFHKFLKDIIINNRYTNENINIHKIYNSIWLFIENEIKNLITNFLENKLIVFDFIISSSFTDNYKHEDNHVSVLVKKYNETSKDQINKGDRFNYIFLIEQNENIINELKKLQEEKEKISLINICKILKWTNIETKINNYKHIYDENLNLKNEKKRICFEIYINKLISDIITLFPETKFIKTKIRENYNGFLSQIKN